MLPVSSKSRPVAPSVRVLTLLPTAAARPSPRRHPVIRSSVLPSKLPLVPGRSLPTVALASSTHKALEKGIHIDYGRSILRRRSAHKPEPSLRQPSAELHLR